MQYFNDDMSKFWLSGPFYDTGSEGGDGDAGDAGSASSGEATDGNAGGDASGDTGKTGDATTQNNDNAQDGEPTYEELLARNTSLQGEVKELGVKYGKQSNALGDLKKRLKGDPVVNTSESAQANAGSIILSEDQFNRLVENRKNDPSGVATNATNPLEQRVDSLASSMEQVGDHLLHQRMVEKFTPEELQGYESRVTEMATGLANGTISYEEIFNFAVRGERVQQIITRAKKAGADEYAVKLQTEANATMPSAGTGRQQSSGAPQRKVVEADDAHERMYGKKKQAS